MINGQKQAPSKDDFNHLRSALCSASIYLSSWSASKLSMTWILFPEMNLGLQALSIQTQIQTHAVLSNSPCLALITLGTQGL